MGRRGIRGRNLSHIQANHGDARSSIGDSHVDLAVGTLKKTAEASVSLLTTYNHSRGGTLPMLFDDDDLDKLRQVRGMVRTQGDIRGYAMGQGVHLYIDFEEALVPAIETIRLRINPDRVGPLLTYINEVKAVHDRFEEVKGVLQWLNRNATPGAVRYYWPMAMKLCPQAPVWRDLQEVPTRYSTPPHIGDWIQSLKDAAATVTGSIMMPSDAKPNPRGKMWLTFAPRTIRLSEHSTYSTDQMTYHI
jgi:hypothetical protein